MREGEAGGRRERREEGRGLREEREGDGGEQSTAHSRSGQTQLSPATVRDTVTRKEMSPNPRWEKTNEEELENPENTNALQILLRWIDSIPHSLKNTNCGMTGHMLGTKGYKTPKMGYLRGSVS